MQTSGVEAKALQAARQSLAAFTAAEQTHLDAVSAQLANLSPTAEGLVVVEAQAELSGANADVASITIAQDTLEVAQKAEDIAPAVAAWAIK